MPETSPCSTDNYVDPPASPISSLNNDILWYIFSLNADMEQVLEKDTPALLTLQYTSQVCSNWRVLAIRSPSFWGLVLNFKLLSQKGGKWRREVVRRTGIAPLHLRFSAEYSKLGRIELFLRRLVDENWHRIQSLDFQFGLVRFRPAVSEQWFKIFQRPTHSLQSFRFSWPVCPTDLSNNGSSLFSNEASSLQTLSVRSIKLNLTALSVPNIRCLELNSSISASDFLYALRRMPLLEILRASTNGPFIRGGNMHSSLSDVTLPYLTDINISERNGADDSMSVLKNLIPASGCTLSYFHGGVHQSANHDSIELYHDILSTYSGYCTELESATKLNMKVSEKIFCFSVCLPSNRLFTFGMDSTTRFPEKMVPTVLASLTTLRLEKIKKIELYVTLAERLLLDTSVVKFFASLISVEVLKTDGTALNAFTVIQSNTKVATIPSCRIIHLDYVYDRVKLSWAVKFIDARIKLGFPVELLTVKLGTFVTVNSEPLRKFLPGLTLQRGD